MSPESLLKEGKYTCNLCPPLLKSSLKNAHRISTVCLALCVAPQMLTAGLER